MVTIIKKGTSIDEIKRKIDEIFSRSSKREILKYAGKLKTDINPLEFQKRMRDEWE